MARVPLLLVLGGLICIGCDRRSSLADEQGAPPPPPAASVQPKACESGGGTVADPIAKPFFPRVIAGYCIDPTGETRAYGREATKTLEDVCNEVLNGECEVYKSHGLERVVTLRYVDGGGSPATISVTLSRFDGTLGAYSFYSRRVVADDDPAKSTLRAIPVTGSAALGTGIAYVWRGAHVAELSYTNELESPEKIRDSSRRLLPELAKALSEQLPGEPSPPANVQALPEEDRLELGVRLELDEVLGIAGIGPAATAHYQRADGRRWRVVAIARPDEDGAKDVLATLRKLDGAETTKASGLEALAFARGDAGEPKAGYLAARAGATVIIVGDEEHALDREKSDAENDTVRLPRDEKRERLSQALARLKR
jgi:hypothetical protein